MEIIWQSKYVRLLTIALLLQAVLFYTASHGDAVPLTQPLNKFPESLAGWQMISQGVVEKDTLDVLKADDVLSRFYVRTPKTDISLMTREGKEALFTSAAELFVAYFSTQQYGQSPHSPKNCLPGSGWQAVDSGEVSIPIPGMTNPISINKYVIAKAENQSVVLYWYQSHGRVVASEFAAKFYLVTDSVRYHRSDTSLVRVVVPVIQGDQERALNSATAFVQAVYPAIYHFLPL